uniref:Ig-like domain-containing protein n=1 Tax=Gadus morhua TaxID=8049 RepID=A0A8C5BML1_GADMO
PLKILRSNCLTLSFLQFTNYLSIFSAMIDTNEVPRIVSLKTAILGDKVTLHCGAEKEGKNRVWYKQSIGYVPQKVALIVEEYSEISPAFNSRFTAAAPDMDLNIRSVSKEDEANYFCQEHYSKDWSGLFLSVKGKISCSTCFLYHLKVAQMYSISQFVSQTVVQQPVSASAQLGEPVALQCSITSQRTDHSNQCQGEPSVYWFRSGPSHPAAIYMNGNRSGECQNSSGPPSAPQSCVYTLPKNNADSSDAGTYYCALAACGEVVFGNGTKLDVFQNGDGETNSLNYAELEFSGRKTKGGKKNRERTQESLYSAVRETCP